MGNKVGTRRQVVDEKYTRPQGLYETPGVDLKRLRNLILAYKLAPCYPGEDDASLDLEECPICFMNYPSLNRSRCCHKGICTECYLQLQSTCACHPAKCPFCKSSNFDIEYRGVRTNEEKMMEQIEEQKFIEAVMRKRQQQLNDEKEKTMQRQYLNSPSRQNVTTQLDNHDVSLNMLSVTPTRRREHVQRSGLSPASLSITRSQSPSPLRDDSIDAGFDDLMLEEALWLSHQEQGAVLIGGSAPIPSPNSGRATCREESESEIDASFSADLGMSSSHLPESFEERLMLAMFISIAEI